MKCGQLRIQLSSHLTQSLTLYRRLRDKLIEEERWSLAMEVSTKCGIDAVGVWVSWGKACVRVGDYGAAREKFAKCFKVSWTGYFGHN